MAVLGDTESQFSLTELHPAGFGGTEKGGGILPSSEEGLQSTAASSGIFP